MSFKAFFLQFDIEISYFSHSLGYDTPTDINPIT